MAGISVPELGSRGDSAGITALGLAAAIAWVWFPYRALLITGGIVAVLGGASLIADLRRGPAWHERDVMIRRLWTAAKRIPSDVVLADAETGELLTAERERGWLTLAVTDPPVPGGQPVVTRYPLGQWAAPNPPPLYRHLAALEDLPPAPVAVAAEDPAGVVQPAGRGAGGGPGGADEPDGAARASGAPGRPLSSGAGQQGSRGATCRTRVDPASPRR